VHRNSVLIKIQPDATLRRYLFTANMFRVSQHPSSGVLNTVTAASDTGHNSGTATSLQRGLIGPNPFVQVSRSVEQNVYPTFPFSNPISVSEELQSWGCSKILLPFLMRFDGLFDQISSNSNNVCLSSIRFWTANSLIIFYPPPSVSKSRILYKNV